MKHRAEFNRGHSQDAELVSANPTTYLFREAVSEEARLSPKLLPNWKAQLLVTVGEQQWEKKKKKKSTKLAARSLRSDTGCVHYSRNSMAKQMGHEKRREKS